MKRYRVEFSPAATRHAERIQKWWAENRPKARGLFKREIASAIRHLTRAPHSAPVYESGDLPAVRRLLMPRTRHHVYFTIDDESELVRVHAVWHASRGAGPGQGA